MIAAAVALALAVDPSVKPWPVGAGAKYRPRATPAAIGQGRAVEGLTCARTGRTFAVHVELFANRRAVVIPAGIGVARPFQSFLGTVQPRGCTYPVRTLTPTGVVQVAAGARLTVGDLFRVWGEPLAATRLGPFASRRPVRAYVAGRLVAGDPAAIALERGEQIVLEIDGYVPPHPSFLFPKGS